MSLEKLYALVEAHVIDAEGHGVAADDLRRDPQGWAEMVVEWGVSMAPVRSPPEAAQQDAQNFRRAVVELGYEEQRGVEVNARASLDGLEAVEGWRGGVSLTCFPFAVAHDQPVTIDRSVPYVLADFSAQPGS